MFCLLFINVIIRFKNILEENVVVAPKQVSLQLPKLKKIGDDKLPTLKLPK